MTTSPDGLTVTTAASPGPLMATPMVTAMRADSSQLQRRGQVRPHRPSISGPAVRLLFRSRGGGGDGPGGGGGGGAGGGGGRSSGGVTRSVGRISRAAGQRRKPCSRVLIRRPGRSRQGRATNYDELRALGDPVAIGIRIVETAFDAKADSTIADAEERGIVAEVVAWILEQPSDQTPSLPRRSFVRRHRDDDRRDGADRNRVDVVSAGRVLCRAAERGTTGPRGRRGSRHRPISPPPAPPAGDVHRDRDRNPQHGIIFGVAP